MVSAQARASVSAIDYHFGSLEQLFVRAQDDAIGRAGDWMDGISKDLSGLGRADVPATMLASLIATIIDEWTEAQRPLALAWREAHAVARARPGLGQAHGEWSRLWGAFWSDLCSGFGLPDKADLVALFFDGEATQHLIRWRRPLDRTLLDETVLALSRFAIEGVTAPTSRVRHTSQDLADEAYRTVSQKRDGSALEDAAAALLAEEGVASLTFRAVAKRAGATLGAASHHFGSKADMLRQAVQRLYETGLNRSLSDPAAALPSTPEGMVDSIVANVNGGREPILRAFDEITLNLCRGESHDALCGLIRGFRDPIAQAVLEKLLAVRGGASASLAAAMSSVVRGYSHRSLGMAREDGEELGRRAMGTFLTK
jgi:AcrR family transcriptional regulator